MICLTNWYNAFRKWQNSLCNDNHNEKVEVRVHKRNKSNFGKFERIFEHQFYYELEFFGLSRRRIARQCVLSLMSNSNIKILKWFWFFRTKSSSTSLLRRALNEKSFYKVIFACSTKYKPKRKIFKKKDVRKRSYKKNQNHQCRL